MYHHGKSVCSDFVISCALIGIFELSPCRPDQELEGGE